MKNRKNPKPRTSAEVNAHIRKDWNGVNPVTKIIPDKRAKKIKKAIDKDQ